jgi:hypothetical protein
MPYIPQGRKGAEPTGRRSETSAVTGTSPYAKSKKPKLASQLGLLVDQIGFVLVRDAVDSHLLLS